jgi:hypothetical protein
MIPKSTLRGDRMDMFTAIIMALIYNLGNMVGLYGTFFLVEASKFFELL